MQQYQGTFFIVFVVGRRVLCAAGCLASSEMCLHQYPLGSTPFLPSRQYDVADTSFNTSLFVSPLKRS